MTQQPLQRPTGVYLLAGLFILAPLGNIIFSLALSQTDKWYTWPVMSSLLASVPWLDWLWLSLVVVTGILLLFAHKTSWSLAVLILLAVLAINLYRGFSPPAAGAYSSLHMLLSTAVTAVVLVLAFYFRYPYLDRRAHWFFPTAVRYELRSPVQIVAQDIFDGVTESISLSGARIRLKRDMGSQSHKLRFVDVIYLDVRNLKILCEVVEYSDNILRLRHKRMTRKDREMLMNWLQSQNENDVSPGQV